MDHVGNPRHDLRAQQEVNARQLQAATEQLAHKAAQAVGAWNAGDLGALEKALGRLEQAVFIYLGAGGKG